MPCVNITKHSLTQKCFIHNLTYNLTCLERHYVLLANSTHKFRVQSMTFGLKSTIMFIMFKLMAGCLEMNQLKYQKLKKNSEKFEGLVAYCSCQQ